MSQPSWRAQANPQDARPVDSSEERLRCKFCGTAGGSHRTSDGKCPALFGWGSMKPLPRWPNTVRDQVKAGALFDKRLTQYWAASKTWFKGEK